LRIVAHLEGHFIKTGCYVCGERFDLGCSGDGEGDYGISYDLYADDGEHCGCVCYTCIQLPADAIKARLRAYARSVAVKRPQHAAAVLALAEEAMTREWIAHLDLKTGQAWIDRKRGE
jgi:hypothetical protein